MATLHEKYREDGFEICAFPSNDFAEEEPLSDQQIIKLLRGKYSARYLVFKKQSVADNPVFEYLAAKSGMDPTWNFQKYLVDGQGVCQIVYPPDTQPVACEPDIRAMLGLN